MRKKLLIGITAPVIAALGLWMGLGWSAAATPAKAGRTSASMPQAAVLVGQSAHPAKATLQAKGSEDPSAPDTDNVQSGDQSASDSESTNKGESTSAETDNVDCQQNGEFDGVNAAGSGPGCDGSGT
jgi:hypothetical protein